MDRGAWRTTVQGFTKSRTRLSDSTRHACHPANCWALRSPCGLGAKPKMWENLLPSGEKWDSLMHHNQHQIHVLPDTH